MSKNQRGDTIIEVILAVSLLSLVTVSSFTVMQRATSTAYDALERSVVRLRLNEQIELLNYFRDSYISAVASGTAIVGTPAEKWVTIVNQPDATVPTLDTCAAPTGSFYIERTATGTPEYQVLTGGITAATEMPVAGKGLWIASVNSTSSSPKKKYQEFYVIACWPTTTNGEARMSSVVRLYDPS